MRNGLQDLNNYLFEELERLNDDETLEKDGDFEKEIKRAKAISDVAGTIISNANTILSALKAKDEYSLNKKETLMIGLSNEE